jgi:hypothetical protein
MTSIKAGFSEKNKKQGRNYDMERKEFSQRTQRTQRRKQCFSILNSEKNFVGFASFVRNIPGR